MELATEGREFSLEFKGSRAHCGARNLGRDRLASHPDTGNPLQAIFAARLRAALDARNVVATDEGRATALASRLGRSVSTATRWLKGDILPSPATLAEIGTAYGISLDYLLGLAVHDRGLHEDARKDEESPRDPQPILVVDDQPTARKILYEIAAAADPLTAPQVFGAAAEALKWASAYHADLVIADYRLPGMDGLEFVRHLRRLSHFADIPVLMVTVVEDRDLRYRALRQGINDFLLKPIDPHEGIARCKNLLAMSRQQALLRDRASLLGGLVEARTSHVTERAREGLLLLAKLVEWRNGADANHPARVGAIAGLLASALGLRRDEVEAIELGVALHDVGTLAVPEDVICEARGPARGSSPKFEAHTTLGYQLLKGHDSGPLRTAALVALGHHEWFNGSGYPTGLSGDHIPLPARIAAVADRLDTLRGNSPTSSWEQTWASLAEERSSRLDPQLVDALIRNGEQVKEIYGRLPAEARLAVIR
jgi:two-component system response regulator RpfG